MRKFITVFFLVSELFVKFYYYFHKTGWEIDLFTENCKALCKVYLSFEEVLFSQISFVILISVEHSLLF